VTALASVTDPDGRTVVLDAAGWQHIVRPDGHPELASAQAAILRAVSNPHDRQPGSRPGQEWFYGIGFGPSRFVRVVVAYEKGRGRIVTAFPRRRLP